MQPRSVLPIRCAPLYNRVPAAPLSVPLMLRQAQHEAKIDVLDQLSTLILSLSKDEYAPTVGPI
jgi:hypothetical protein